MVAQGFLSSTAGIILLKTSVVGLSEMRVLLSLLWCVNNSFSSLMLQEQRHLTHENVQRKQARTGEEREEEEEEQISESESEDEENEIIYNPKNLPLGWDGKVSGLSGWSGRRHPDPTLPSCLNLLFGLTVVSLCLSAHPILVIQTTWLKHQLQL